MLLLFQNVEDYERLCQVQQQQPSQQGLTYPSVVSNNIASTNMNPFPDFNHTIFQPMQTDLGGLAADDDKQEGYKLR